MYYIMTTLTRYTPPQHTHACNTRQSNPRQTYKVIAPPGRVFLECPACISPVSRLYLTVSLVSRFLVSLYLYQFYIYPFCSGSTVSRCIPPYPVSSCICTYLAVSSCIPLYLALLSTSPRKREIAKNTLQRRGRLRNQS